MNDTRSPRESVSFAAPLIGFAAYSGTGKTTLLLKLVPILKQQGLRLAVVKHAHHSFDMDHPGKDSYRLREAGADEMLVATRRRFGLIRECRDARDEPSLEEALGLLDPEGLDVVLIEGFKHEPIPKIELHRVALGKPLLFPHDPHVIAIASDSDDLAQPPLHIPRLALEDVDAIVDFVLAFIGRGRRDNKGLAG